MPGDAGSAVPCTDVVVVRVVDVNVDVDVCLCGDVRESCDSICVTKNCVAVVLHFYQYASRDYSSNTVH